MVKVKSSYYSKEVLKVSELTRLVLGRKFEKVTCLALLLSKLSLLVLMRYFEDMKTKDLEE